MSKSNSKRNKRRKSKNPKALRLNYKNEVAKAEKSYAHIYANGAVCETDTRGHSTPGNRSPTDLVVHATDGFIPLWEPEVTLRWRFQERAMSVFRNPDAAKSYMRTLFGKGLLLWDDAAPVKFTEASDAWDFEITVRGQDNCSASGCTLASAFFPDGGQHELVLYPKMFQQSRQEQIETLAHEIGHIFGLRHFFAQLEESAWPSEEFTMGSSFSIMNYGPRSFMTHEDRSDLKRLYEMAWDGELTEINGTPVRLMRPFSGFRNPVCESKLVAAY